MMLLWVIEVCVLISTPLEPQKAKKKSMIKNSIFALPEVRVWAKEWNILQAYSNGQRLSYAAGSQSPDSIMW